MSNVLLGLIAEAEQLGSELPVVVAQEIATSKDRSGLLRMISPAPRREALLSLYRRWEGPEESFACSLLTAAVAEERRRRDHSMELVWTGPESHVIPVRQTEQVLLDIIGRARKSLLIVSYAVYRIPRIREALVVAAARGVHLRLVLDVADPNDSETYNPLLSIGSDVAACSEVLYWPRSQRPPDAAARRGILHVKCVVADRSELFVSSANLTEQALRLNMELGLFVTAAGHAVNVDDHFSALIGLGVLRRLDEAATNST